MHAYCSAEHMREMLIECWLSLLNTHGRTHEPAQLYYESG